jgi:hypothetical protein
MAFMEDALADGEGGGLAAGQREIVEGGLHVPECLKGREAGEYKRWRGTYDHCNVGRALGCLYNKDLEGPGL